MASLPAVAASQPDSIEGRLMQHMTTDGSAFCTCVDGAFKSAPAQAINPQCSVPFELVKFMRNNYKACNTLAKVPPSKWAALAALIAREVF
jgi:hypothetical protein